MEAERALDEIPWSPAGRQTLAGLYWELGEPDPAIDMLKEALALEPYNAPRRILLTHWYLDVGRNAEALRSITPLSRMMPEDAEVQLLLEQAQAALAAELQQ